MAICAVFFLLPLQEFNYIIEISLTLYFGENVVLRLLKYLKANVEHLYSVWLVISSLLIFRYYHGPTPIQSLQYATSQDIINSFQSIRQEMEAYTPKLTQVGDLYCLKNRIPILFSEFMSTFTLNCKTNTLMGFKDIFLLNKLKKR